MHDVGKVGIPDAVLNKPGRLTSAEFEIIKSHTTIGHEILSKSDRDLMRSAALVALQHHERWDGAGYPQGLLGEGIHVFGRITALVDVFDALANRRVYRRAREMDDVIAWLRQERGRHFDPQLLDCFLADLPEFISIAAEHPDREQGQASAAVGRA
jgi:response regulator RpfG family c-di-GMP phosphodiesterase